MQDQNRPVSDRPPPGQRTEVTKPAIAIVAALVAVVTFALAFSFWPDTATVHTGATDNLPKAEKTVPDAAQPPKQ